MVFHPGTLKRSEFDFPYIHIYIHTCICMYIHMYIHSPARWPLDSFLKKDVSEPTSFTQRMTEVLRAAERECEGIRDPDLFCDLSTGRTRNPEKALGMTTCLRPSHKCYSVTWKTHIHTYIHSYIHRNLQTQPCVGQNELWKMWDSPMRLKMQVHTYVHTYICTYISVFKCAYIYIRTYVYIHTYTIFLHSCMHAYMHTYIEICKHSHVWDKMNYGKCGTHQCV